MDNSRSKNIKHLYSRAGFGIHYPELERLKKQKLNKVIDGLFKASAKVQDLDLVEKDREKKSYKELSAEEKKERQRQARENTRSLNIAFLERLSGSQAALREKMTLFWHGHFACRSPQNPFALQELNNVQRKHALGNFKTLTVEVSKTPAMLAFLNNQQNRKGKPNENFARELMELFTLGRGNYTEDDIKASARAFTGWMYNGDMEFVFREKQHDAGKKTFFGKTGNFQGQDIIDMIFEQKQCAYFITGKLYAFFVNETPDESRVKELGDYLYAENYELEPLLRKMFSADWFYAPENVGNKIKSPVEFIAGLNKQFFIDYEEPNVLLKFQQALGQMLFYPPNVAGWSGGRNFVDSSSLMVRLKIPATVLNNGIIEFEGKTDPEDEAYIAVTKKASKKIAQRIKARVDWEKFLKEIPAKISNEELAAFLLQPSVSEHILNGISNSSEIKTRVVQLISTPEYQLC